MEKNADQEGGCSSEIQHGLGCRYSSECDRGFYQRLLRRRQMLYSYCYKIFCELNQIKRTREGLWFLTANTEHLVKPRTYPTIISSSTRSNFIIFSKALHPKSGLGRLTVEVSRTHTDTSHLVGLPWTRDQPVVETST